MNGEIIGVLPGEAARFLPQMYEWGIAVIRVIQELKSPVLTALVKFITVLGTEALYLPMILFIFWWIDEKRGLRLGILIIVCAWINSFVKDILKQPRPFNLEPSVGLASEPSYGAPSGHAQMSLCFWIPMAAWLDKVRPRRRLLIWAAAIFFVLLIAFTRLYLGVHFPTDIFAGWILAAIILFIWFVPGPSIEKFLAAGGTRLQNICAAGIVLVMNGLYPKERTFPALFLGFCLGYTMMRRRFPFSARAEINGRKPGITIMILRCLTGFAGMVLIYLGLKLIFPGEGSLFKSIPAWGQASPYYELGRFIRYGLLGFWVSAGAPLLFQRMRLASVPVEGEDSPGTNGNTQ